MPIVSEPQTNRQMFEMSQIEYDKWVNSAGESSCQKLVVLGYNSIKPFLTETADGQESGWEREGNDVLYQESQQGTPYTIFLFSI